MNLEGIRDFFRKAIPQIAALDGENNKLGDSPREVSIMSRLLQEATPEEKDFVQKYLDGEPIVNPQGKNEKSVVRYPYQLKGNSEIEEYLKDISYYETTYDKEGKAKEALFYNKSDEVVAKQWGTESDFHFERTDGSYSFHQIVNGDDFYRIDKQAGQNDEGQDYKQYTGVTSKYYFIAEDGHVYVVNKKGTKGVDYEISNNIVKLPQKALKQYSNIDTMLKECGYKVEVE